MRRSACHGTRGGSRRTSDRGPTGEVRHRIGGIDGDGRGGRSRCRIRYSSSLAQQEIGNFVSVIVAQEGGGSAGVRVNLEDNRRPKLQLGIEVVFDSRPWRGTKTSFSVYGSQDSRPPDRVWTVTWFG